MKKIKFLIQVTDKNTKEEYKAGHIVEFEDKRADEILALKLTSGEHYAIEVKEIEKEIQKSDIGINPNNDGKVIRLVFPELTEERRKELVKEIKKIAEDSKVAIRSIRRDGMDEFKTKQKNNEITEDDLRDAEDKIQKLTDKYVENVESICEAKEKEVMSV